MSRSPWQRSRQAFARDIVRLLERQPSRPELLWYICTRPGLLAVALLRLQSFLWDGPLRPVGKVVSALNLILTGAEFVGGCAVGGGLIIRHPGGLVVGGGVIMGEDCTIVHGGTLGERYGDGSGDHRYPRVGDNVTIGAGARILGGIFLGSHTVVGAGAVVLADVESGRTVVGVPAQPVDRTAQADPGSSSVDPAAQSSRRLEIAPEARNYSGVEQGGTYL
jgi:serine O-acetyltransferase